MHLFCWLIQLIELIVEEYLLRLIVLQALRKFSLQLNLQLAIRTLDALCCKLSQKKLTCKSFFFLLKPLSQRRHLFCWLIQLIELIVEEYLLRLIVLLVSRKFSLQLNLQLAIRTLDALCSKLSQKKLTCKSFSCLNFYPSEGICFAG